MLKDSFYKADPILDEGDGKYICTIYLNGGHPIFDGHFPEMKVMPGVTMVQIIKETCETVLEQSLKLQSSRMIKFLSMVLPEVDSKLFVEVTLKNEVAPWEVSGVLRNEEKVFFKMKGTFNANN